MPQVAVVILSWNGEQMLRRFLPGVVASLPAWATAVVADNGSNDGSCAWVEKHFPQVQLIRLEKNYGFAEGYNRALAEVEADIYLLLNSDVETPKGWMEPLIECLERHPETAAVAPKLRSERQHDTFEYAGAAGGYIDYWGYPFCRGRILKHLERDEGQYDDEREVFWVSGAAFCCRAADFHAAGGFDGDFFAHMEEIDLCWRLQLRGRTIRIVPQSVVYHVGGATLAVDSPLKIYLNHRNNLQMLFKCSSPEQRLCVAVVRPLTDALAAFSYLLQGHFRAFVAVGRAWVDFLKAHRTLARKRREVRRTILCQPAGIYRGSILLRYLCGKHCFDNLL